jgi:hypothetical protein
MAGWVIATWVRGKSVETLDPDHQVDPSPRGVGGMMRAGREQALSCDHRQHMSWMRLLACADVGARKCPACGQRVRQGALPMFLANGSLAVALFLAVGWSGVVRSTATYLWIPLVYVASRYLLVRFARPKVQAPSRYGWLWFGLLVAVLAASAWLPGLVV